MATSFSHDSRKLAETYDRLSDSQFEGGKFLVERLGLGAGARVLDLFAGTGALGLEALSRGAGYAVFIEESAQGRGLIRTNVEAFGLTGRTKIFRRDATKLGEAGTLASFDLVFADPPYGKGLGERALHSARQGGWLTPGALCVIEEVASAPFDPGPNFVVADERSYGETVIRFLEIR